MTKKTIILYMLLCPIIISIVLMSSGDRADELYGWINRAGRQRWYAEKISHAIDLGYEKQFLSTKQLWLTNHESLYIENMPLFLDRQLDNIGLVIENLEIEHENSAEFAASVSDQMDTIITFVDKMATAEASSSKSFISQIVALIFCMVTIGYIHLGKDD